MGSIDIEMPKIEIPAAGNKSIEADIPGIIEIRCFPTNLEGLDALNQQISEAMRKSLVELFSSILEAKHEELPELVYAAGDYTLSQSEYWFESFRGDPTNPAVIAFRYDFSTRLILVGNKNAAPKEIFYASREFVADTITQNIMSDLRQSLQQLCSSIAESDVKPLVRH